MVTTTSTSAPLTHQKRNKPLKLFSAATIELPKTLPPAAAAHYSCFICAQVAGVPCMYISGRKYTIERMPEAFGAPKS